MIERSFGVWLAALTEMQRPDSNQAIEVLVDFESSQIMRALTVAPDFLRLGLMLALEHHPEDPTARKTFLKVRSQAFRNAVKIYRKWLPELNKRALEELASFCVALADGFFISREVADDTHDLMKHQELFSAAVIGVIARLRAAQEEN